MEPKSFVLSKINWLGGLLVLLAFLAGPEFAAVFGTNEFQDAFREAFGPHALAGLGVLLIVLRTWFTSKPVTRYAAKDSRRIPPSRLTFLVLTALLAAPPVGCASRGVEGATTKERLLIEAAGAIAVAQETRADLNEALAATVRAACLRPGEACERRREFVRPIAGRLFQAGAILDKAEGLYRRARAGGSGLSLALHAVTDAAVIFAAVRSEAAAGEVPVPDRVDAAIAALAPR